jgi:flagellar basal body-associated protein FliL
MFTVTSNPFAEMTQGLSGQQNTEHVQPVIRKEYDDHFEYKKSSSSGWWTVIFIVLLLLSGIGLFFWLYSIYQNKKEEERKKLEEEQKKLAEKQKEITS